MAKIFTPFIILIFITVACQNSSKIKLRAPQAIKGVVIGDSVLENNVKNSEGLIALANNHNSTKTKVRGIVKCVCKKNGSWLKLDSGSDKEIIISFRDKAYNFPQSIAGKEVVFDGEAKIETLSIEQQKSLAFDDGADKTEISKITNPKEVVLFETTGLVIL